MKKITCPKCQGYGGYPFCGTCKNQMFILVQDDYADYVRNLEINLSVARDALLEIFLWAENGPTVARDISMKALKEIKQLKYE